MFISEFSQGDFRTGDIGLDMACIGIAVKADVRPDTFFPEPPSQRLPRSSHIVTARIETEGHILPWDLKKLNHRITAAIKAAGIMSAKYDTPNQTKPKELEKVKETMTREEVETLILAACTEERNMYNWKIQELERKIAALSADVPVPKVEVENGYRQEIDNLHNRVQILEANQ